MYRYVAFAVVALGTACTTNDQGVRVVDMNAVKTATLITCALEPTAAQIAQLYTDNKNVKTTDQAAQLLCNAAVPVLTK